MAPCEIHLRKAVAFAKQSFMTSEDGDQPTALLALLAVLLDLSLKR